MESPRFQWLCTLGDHAGRPHFNEHSWRPPLEGHAQPAGGHEGKTSKTCAATLASPPSETAGAPKGPALVRGRRAERPGHRSVLLATSMGGLREKARSGHRLAASSHVPFLPPVPAQRHPRECHEEREAAEGEARRPDLTIELPLNSFFE